MIPNRTNYILLSSKINRFNNMKGSIRFKMHKSIFIAFTASLVYVSNAFSFYSAGSSQLEKRALVLSETRQLDTQYYSTEAQSLLSSASTYYNNDESNNLITLPRYLNDLVARKAKKGEDLQNVGLFFKFSLGR